MKLEALAPALAAGWLLAVATGCGRPDHALMPLEVGKSWTYEVRSPRLTSVAEVRVARRLAVDGVEGYELVGELGSERLAWKGPILEVANLAAVRYEPPLPILDARTPAPGLAWSGRAIFPTRTVRAQATLAEAPTTFELSNRKTPAIKTTLALDLPAGRLVLTSWFVAGVGLVRQEQRTNGIQDVALELVGGA